MAEAIAALSLACNVFQVISFAHEVYNVTKEIEETGSSDSIALYHATQLSDLSTTLGNKINDVRPISKEQFVLRGHAEKCLDLSLKLQKNLKLEGRGGGLKKAFKARWKKSSTKKHAEELFALEQSMQTQILAYSWIRDQAVEAEQEQGFKNVDTQIQTFVRQVVAGHTKLEGLLQKEATVIKTHTTTEAAKIRDHVTAETSKTTDRLAQESGLQERKARLAKLLASLEYPEMNARRNQSSIDAYEDTFQWIFEENEKRAWDSFPSFLTSQDQTLYWISGKPGAGKSTLMKFLVQHDRTTELLERWSSNPLTVSYFFWLRGSPMQRSTKGLLSSLVRQILDSQSNTPNFPLNSNVWSKQSINDWSSQELQQLLLQCLTTTNRPVCLFLDGLDEMDQKEDSFDLIALIHKISNQKHTKVCLASRPERLFHNQYSSSPTMRLQDLTEPDIRHYVSQQLGNYTSNSQSDNGKKDREKLVQLVVEKAQGVFLWVYLVLRSLRRGIEVRNDDWDVLIRRVKEKPSDLDHLYKDMLTRLGNEMNLYQHEAAFYFAFVLDDVTTLSQLTFANSKRPQNVIDAGESLPPLEILNSECERRQRQVEDYSAGLLEVTKWQILDISLQNLREEVDRLCECQWARFQIIASRKPGDDVFAFQTLLHLRRYTANCRQEVRFIHRTAADFLLNTTEGQGILASYHAAAGEIKVKRSESEAFAWLAGSGAPISYLLHAKNWVLEGDASKDSKWKQLGHLKLWFDKMFYSYLGDLENLRGSKLCYTTKLLYETAKETVAQYITNLGQFGELSAIKKYVEYTEALGYQLTNDFSSFVLFKTIQWHHEDWGTCHRDVISYLLKLGADPNDSTREWSWFSMNLIPPAYQKQSALEVFIYNILNLSYQDSDDMPHLATAAVSLAATLKDLLEHKPNLERRILYEIFIKGKTPTTDPIKSSRSIHSWTMWELSLAPLLQAVASRIDHPTEAKPPLVIHRVPLDADSAKLVFFRNAIGNFIPTKTLEPPLLLKLGDFVGSYYPEIEVTEEVSQILRNVLDEGEELTTSEAVKRLRSEGHDVRKRSEWFHGNRYYPIPFNGFKEYYATQPTDGPVVPTSKTRVEQDSASDSSLVEAIGTIELGSS